MATKQSNTYVNYQERATEFAVGDPVVPFGVGMESLGAVTAVWPAIGMVDVEFPHGNRRYPVEELQRVRKDAPIVEPQTDSVPGGSGTVEVSGGPYPMKDEVDVPHPVALDKAAETVSKQAAPLATPVKTRQESLNRIVPRVAQLWARKQLHKLAAEEIQQEIKQAAKDPEIASIVLESQETPQTDKTARDLTALYWNGKDRKYRARQGESDGKRYYCPKCKDVRLQKAVYKREEGKSDRLLGCKQCLFLVRRDDVTGHHELAQELSEPSVDGTDPVQD